MTTNEQKGRELYELYWHKSGCVSLEHWLTTHIVPKLATPDHEAALVACERVAVDYPSCHLMGDGSNDSALGAAVRVGRRSLDAKKPKERWTVCRSASSLPWCVWEDMDSHNQPVAWFQTEARARSYAADMNAKEAAR